MRKITKQVGLKLNIKIGGCEAKNDIFFCTSTKVDGIVAPMVESEYALKKFIQTIPKYFNGSFLLILRVKMDFQILKKSLKQKNLRN